jgi:AraC family transcriptional regulator
MFQSLEIDTQTYADRTFCSWEHGWRSLLLQRFAGHATVDEAVIPPVPEQTIVLVTRGEATIESGADGPWRQARYSPGQIALTAPNRAVRLRWRMPHETLHLCLPAATTSRIVEEVWDRDPTRVSLPDTLATIDPLLEQTMLGLLRAAEEGVPDLYAESAVEFVIAHTLVRHGTMPRARRGGGDDERIRCVRSYLRENLHLPITLAEMAAEAGLSRYHFLRVFRRQTGETPLRYLTRLRVERGQEELRRGSASVSEIAMRNGFASAAHFSTAFRRQTGYAPSAYRKLHKLPGG